MPKALTKQQVAAKRRARVALWQKLVGARPAWLVSLAFSLVCWIGKEYMDIRERITRTESGLLSHHEEAEKAHAALWEGVRRVRDKCDQGCRR